VAAIEVHNARLEVTDYQMSKKRRLVVPGVCKDRWYIPNRLHESYARMGKERASCKSWNWHGQNREALLCRTA